MNRARWWLLVGVAAIVPLVGVVIFAGALVAYEYRISRNPMTARAEVVEKLDSQREGERNFDLRYRFVSASGGEYGGWIRASGEIFDRSSVGDSIEIRYAGDVPEYHEVTSVNLNFMPLLDVVTPGTDAQNAPIVRCS